MVSAICMDGIRRDGLLCTVPLFRDLWLLDLIAPTGTTYTVGIMILRLPLATCSGSFGEFLEFCLYDVSCDLPYVKRRWRVALMEEGIKLIDFESVDQMVQVHGTCLIPRTCE